MGGGKCQVRPPNCQGEATQHCAVLVVLPWLSHTPGDCVVFCMIPLRLFLGLRSYIGLLFNFQPFIMHSIVTFKRTASKIYVNHGFQPLKWLYRKRNYFLHDIACKQVITFCWIASLQSLAPTLFALLANCVSCVKCLSVRQQNVSCTLLVNNAR